MSEVHKLACSRPVSEYSYIHPYFQHGLGGGTGPLCLPPLPGSSPVMTAFELNGYNQVSN